MGGRTPRVRPAFSSSSGASSPVSDAIVAICPSCSQKYRVRRDNVGQKARCKKCGQSFRILDEPPIDDETVFGWVTEDDPGGSSVLGGTGIFGSSFHESTHVPAGNRWVHPPPPPEPRVEFENLDEQGASFRFSPELLQESELRCSFPHRCVQCLGREDLEVHFVIWPEKVPAKDAALISETETRSHRTLDQLIATHGLKWFDSLERIESLPIPYSHPIAYCVCPQCSVIGAVRGRVLQDGDAETCQLIINHPSIALDFYRNNGGRNTPGYKKLLVAARQRRDNQWKSLAVGVRVRLGEWYKPKGGETFLGYYADRDFDKAERGCAGVVLTDQRLVYKKYQALRDYPLDVAGRLDIEASRSAATVEISQHNQRDSILSTTPLAASSLARSLSNLKKPWQINVATIA